MERRRRRLSSVDEDDDEDPSEKWPSFLEVEFNEEAFRSFSLDESNEDRESRVLLLLNPGEEGVGKTQKERLLGMQSQLSVGLLMNS